MSLLDLDQARADYTAWVTGTDDPPTLDDEEARLLSHRIAAHHFPNLLAERDQLVEKINALADSLDNETVATLWPPDDEMKRGYRHGVDVTRRDAARRLRGLVSGDKDA